MLKHIYTETMTEKLDPTINDFINHFEATHKQTKQLVLAMFESQKKMGTEVHLKTFTAVLSENIDKKYDELREVASDNHERFWEEIEKIELEKIDKDVKEQELLDELQESISKIAKFKASNQNMDRQEFDEKLQVLNKQKQDNEEKIEEYRLNLKTSRQNNLRLFLAAIAAAAMMSG